MRVTLAGRRSALQWQKLSALLASVELGVAALARIDARTQACHSQATTRDLVAFDSRMRILERHLDHELDLLTVERLTLDLAAKQQPHVA